MKMLDEREVLYNRKYYWALKRGQDIIFAGLAIVILMPLLILVALIIFLDDPHGSPIFIQKRVGRKGKLFYFLKFRTMVMNAEAQLEGLMDQNEKDGPVFKMKNDPRITRVGKFLRRTSLDELPQLFNILMGDMSIVGPRPALPKEVAQYNRYQKQRLLVQPGLTCYWQIQPNRDQIGFDEWIDLDVKYIRERNFWVDWKIVFRTVLAVINGSGE